MTNSSRLATLENQTDIFQSIANKIHHITSLPVSIWAPDENKTVLNIVAAVGLPSDYVQTASLDLKKTSVTGDAYKTKKIQVTRDISTDTRWHYKKQAREMNWKSAISVPIEVDGASIGTISVYGYTERSISDLRHILPDFAKQIALTLEVSKQKEILQQIFAINAKLRMKTDSPKSALYEIIKGVSEITGADSVIAYQYDFENKGMGIISNIVTHGLINNLNELDEKSQIEGGIIDFNQKDEIFFSGEGKQESILLKTNSLIIREQIISFMGITLKAGEDILGVVYINFRSQHKFTDVEKNMIRHFVYQASLVINNTRLHQLTNKKVHPLAKVFKVAKNDVTTNLTQGEILHIKLDLRSSIPLDEFVDIISAIEFIYSVFAILNSADQKTITLLTDFIKQYAKTNTKSKLSLNTVLGTTKLESLRLVSIHYGSPATFDLLGISNILEQVRDTIKDISWKAEHERKIAEVELDKLKLETEKIAVEIAKDKIGLIEKTSQLKLSSSDKSLIISALAREINMLDISTSVPLLHSGQTISVRARTKNRNNKAKKNTSNKKYSKKLKS